MNGLLLFLACNQTPPSPVASCQAALAVPDAGLIQAACVPLFQAESCQLAWTQPSPDLPVDEAIVRGCTAAYCDLLSDPLCAEDTRVAADRQRFFARVLRNDLHDNTIPQADIDALAMGLVAVITPVPADPAIELPMLPSGAESP